MQDTGGLKRLLSFSGFYKLFQRLVGAEYGRNWLASHYWRLKGGEKIIDIGCGPGDVVEYLPPDVEYVGFDISREYIEAARKKWGKRATFVVGTPGEMRQNIDQHLFNADLVICNGVLHHLDDHETIEVLQLANSIMAPTGRFVCLEPVNLVHQSWLSGWVMKRDRGQHVRQEQEWKDLFGQVFQGYSTNVATHLIRIPYNYIIIECGKSQ